MNSSKGEQEIINKLNVIKVSRKKLQNTMLLRWVAKKSTKLAGYNVIEKQSYKVTSSCTRLIGHIVISHSCACD